MKNVKKQFLFFKMVDYNFSIIFNAPIECFQRKKTNIVKLTIYSCKKSRKQYTFVCFLIIFYLIKLYNINLNYKCKLSLNILLKLDPFIFTKLFSYLRIKCILS